MKSLLFALLSLSFSIGGLAQGTAFSLPSVRGGHYDFVRKLADEAYGLSMELQQDAGDAEEMLVKALRNATGNKPKSLKKDVYLLESTVLPAISSNRMDYYYRVESTGSRSLPRSRVTFFISLGNYNFITPNTHPQELEAARRWLSHIPVEARILELSAMEAQRLEAVEEVLKDRQDLQNGLSKLENDKVKLEEKIAELQVELETLKQELELQQLEIENSALLQQEKEAALKEIRDEILRLKGL